MTPSKEVENFFLTKKLAPASFGHLPFDQNLKLTPASQIPWFEFFMRDFPTEDILQEVKSIKHLFVEHREESLHKGWKSICLHGISAEKTMCHFDYGLSEDEVVYGWTEIESLCPITTNYFKNIFPAEKYKRIRFMLVEPGGFVGPHRDRENKSLGPLTIALNTPQNCRFGIDGFGVIPIQPGGFYLVDLSNRHSVWNQSNEDRFHITVECAHGKYHNEYLKQLFCTYEQKHPLRRWFNSTYWKMRKVFL
jgi:hypothetical protein